MQHTDRASDGGNGGLALHAEAQRLAAAEAVLQGVRSRPSLTNLILSICARILCLALLQMLSCKQSFILHIASECCRRPEVWIWWLIFGIQVAPCTLTLGIIPGQDRW